MTTLFATIRRAQRERRGVLIEAVIAEDISPATLPALERAVDASLAEMGREGIVGKLLGVASAGGRIVMTALVTAARAATLVSERVYKGIEIALLGNEIQEIALVDRPLTKSICGETVKISILYKRSEEGMSMLSALHKYYGTAPIRGPSKAEVAAVWEKMTPTERALASIKATLASPSSGGRDFLDWYANRAFKGGGTGVRRPGGQF